MSSNESFNDRFGSAEAEHRQTMMWAGIGFAVFIVIIGVLMYFSYKWRTKKYNEWQDEASDKKDALTQPYYDILRDPNASSVDKRKAQEMITEIELKIYNARQRNRHMHNF